MTRISSMRDLTTWVWDHMPSDTTEDEIHTVAEAIRANDHRPPWGSDWQGFLDTLPDNMIERAAPPDIDRADIKADAEAHVRRESGITTSPFYRE